MFHEVPQKQIHYWLNHFVMWATCCLCFTCMGYGSGVVRWIIIHCLQLQLKYWYNSYLRRANPSLGGTTKNHTKEWLRNQNWSNGFSTPFSLNVFITIIFFSHVYQFHVLVYCHKLLLESKRWKLKQTFIFYCHGPFRNHALEL